MRRLDPPARIRRRTVASARSSARLLIVGLGVAVLASGCSAPASEPSAAGASAAPSAMSSLAAAPSEVVAPAAPRSSSSAPSAQDTRALVDSVLRRRANAIRDRDAGAWAATGADPGAFAAVRRLAVSDLALVQVRSIVAAATSSPRSPRWIVALDLRYRLADLPTWSGLASAEWVIGPNGPTWRVVEESWTGAAPPWALPGLRCERSAGVVVAGNAAARDLRRIAAQAASARTAMASVWSSGPDLLVIAPATVADLHRLLPTAIPGHDTAAVTTGRSGADGDTVYLFPDIGLSDAGRQATLTHEAVHVVLRERYGSNAPLWLVEGFAQDIGYADLDISASQIAAEGLADIAVHGLPQALPTDRQFDTEPGVAYPLAWRAVRVLTQRRGQAAVRELVGQCADDPGGPSSCSTYLERTWGAPVDTFLEAWRTDLGRLRAEPSADPPPEHQAL